MLVPERACNEDAKQCTKKLLATVDYISGSMFEDVEKLKNETVTIDKKSNDMDSQTNIYVILIMVAFAFSILCIPALLVPAFLLDPAFPASTLNLFKRKAKLYLLNGQV